MYLNKNKRCDNMKIGGYSHFDGITFFCDVLKIKGRRKKNKKNISYDIEWIIPPRWLRKLENKFMLGGLLVAYYQWKVLDKKIRHLFLFLLGFYLMEEIVDLSAIDYYLNYLIDKLGIYIIVAAALIILLNYKKILKIFRYHGAEHKAINCYIQHGYVDPYLIKKASRFNIRCGSNISSIFLVLYAPLWFLNIDSLTIGFIIFLISLQIIRVLAKKNYKWNKYVQILQWITAFNQVQKAHYIYQSELRASKEPLKA